jgi:hypothetical protein
MFKLKAHYALKWFYKSFYSLCHIIVSKKLFIGLLPEPFFASVALHHTVYSDNVFCKEGKIRLYILLLLLQILSHSALFPLGDKTLTYSQTII